MSSVVELNYVEYGPRETAPPPFRAGKGDFLGLLLKGNEQAIKALCDCALNEPFDGNEGRPESPYTFKPYSDAVLLFAGRWEEMVATTAIAKGTADEEQLSLWIPLKAVDKKTQEETNWVMVPYMFVDNPMSLLNGREDYGYPKSFGRFEPRGCESVAVEAFGGIFDPDSVADWVKVIRVHPATPQPGAPKASATGPAFDAAVLRNILAKGVNQVFLKQFRDAQVPGRACYQKLIEAPVEFVDPSVKLKLGEWRVEINTPSPNSHPITEDLGVKTDMTPFAFELTSALKLGAGKIIV